MGHMVPPCYPNVERSTNRFAIDGLVSGADYTDVRAVIDAA